MKARAHPFTDFTNDQGPLVLDGGLATTLEARGFRLVDDLWSARMLLESPDAIRQVHYDFLLSGADCITSASYQATLEGFHRHGISERRGMELLRFSVQLATEARAAFWKQSRNRDRRRYPLVAASVGPFGAFLADGSEYTGDYQISDDDLYEFHRTRWLVLAESAADVLACETIPTRREVDVYLRLLRESPQAVAWLSFCCRDNRHLADGTPIVEVGRACDGVSNVVGVGINCTKPEFVAGLLRELRRVTTKPLIVYPNSGERYDATSHMWIDDRSSPDWLQCASEWVDCGAVAVGGCCRVGPAQIARLCTALASARGDPERRWNQGNAGR